MADNVNIFHITLFVWNIFTHLQKATSFVKYSHVAWDDWRYPGHCEFNPHNAKEWKFCEKTSYFHIIRQGHLGRQGRCISLYKPYGCESSSHIYETRPILWSIFTQWYAPPRHTVEVLTNPRSQKIMFCRACLNVSAPHFLLCYRLQMLDFKHFSDKIALLICGRHFVNTSTVYSGKMAHERKGRKKHRRKTKWNVPAHPMDNETLGGVGTLMWPDQKRNQSQWTAQNPRKPCKWIPISNCPCGHHCRLLVFPSKPGHWKMHVYKNCWFMGRRNIERAHPSGQHRNTNAVGTRAIPKHTGEQGLLDILQIGKPTHKDTLTIKCEITSQHSAYVKIFHKSTKSNHFCEIISHIYKR